MAEADIMSPPPLRVGAAKPKMNIYYTLLIISLCAMLVACLFLFLQIKRYGGFGTVKGKISWIERPAQSLLVGATNRTEQAPPLNHG